MSWGWPLPICKSGWRAQSEPLAAARRTGHSEALYRAAVLSPREGTTVFRPPTAWGRDLARTRRWVLAARRRQEAGGLILLGAKRVEAQVGFAGRTQRQGFWQGTGADREYAAAPLQASRGQHRPHGSEFKCTRARLARKGWSASLRDSQQGDRRAPAYDGTAKASATIWRHCVPLWEMASG